MNLTNTRLLRLTVLLFFIVLIFYALWAAASVLKPMAVALILALLLLPLSRFIEKRLSRTLSSILCVVVIFSGISAVSGLITYQGIRMSEDWDKLKSKGEKRIKKVETYLVEITGFSKKEIRNNIKKSGYPKLKDLAQSLLSKVIDSVLDILLMLIYTFLLLNYRSHFATFLKRLFRQNRDVKTVKTVEEAANAVQSYLKAKFIMIGILSIIYSFGLSILGVKFGIFYGIIAALLSLIPFVGNIIGAGFPLISAIIYNDINTVLLLLVFFAIVQFLESYLIQPALIKKEVDLHPFFSIAFAIIGGSLWGIPGMIIAIPLLAILYILFSNIQGLSVYAYLISENDS